MGVSDRNKTNGDHNMKLFRLCPFWQTATNSSSSPSTQNLNHSHKGSSNSVRHVAVNSSGLKSTTVSSVARSLLPAPRRLRLDPANNLYFPCTLRFNLLPFQTTAPKSCYMRPPGGILAPGESLIATVFKFVEQPENNAKQMDQKSNVKFKIVSLKVKGGIEYVPELCLRINLFRVQTCHFGSFSADKLWLLAFVAYNGFSEMFMRSYKSLIYKFDEQKDQVTVERILRVVFLDAEHPSPAMEKLKLQLAEAEAALEARKKPPPDTGPRVVGEGLVIDEWKERREKYLARQHVEAVE
ncbi:hypothetical protein POTOM_041155 [Populus tomentosa]|uniref:MSP domain-containing protein n=1 Tax=Populus tomentosa TaxID=118781 RepID=A0A8X8CIX3_POPTO|nr:hypothetical protein POTOM_041155 [Populus tomentosa]